MIEILVSTALFCIVIYTCFFIPSRTILSLVKLNLPELDDIFVTLSFGMCLFTLTVYILAWVQLTVLLYPILLVCLLFSIKKKIYFPRKLPTLHKIPMLLVTLGSILFSLPTLLLGQYGNMLAVRHDDTWHLALINELKVHFPPSNPSFAGIPLHGYHFFYDFFTAMISNLFFIAPLSLHFHILPVFFSIMIGIGTYTFVYHWQKNRFSALIAVFLVLFGGSFAFIFSFFVPSGFNIETGFDIGQLISITLVNPPLTTSFILLLLAFYVLYHYTETNNIRWLIPLAIVTGLLPMYKVYAGIILLGGLGFFVLISAIKRDFYPLVSLGISSIIIVLSYWIFASNASYLIYYPLWAPHRLLQSFSWYGYDEKMYTYTRLHYLKGIIETELWGLFLFCIGNLGTRVFGLCLLLRRKIPSLFMVTLVIMMLLSLMIPLLFLQAGSVFNIIQFCSYYIFIASILGAVGFGRLVSKKFPLMLKIVAISILIILTIPTALYVLRTLPEVRKESVSVTSPYFQSMNFLATHGSYDDTVLDIPSKSDSINLETWYTRSSPAITAFGNKRTYFDSEFIDFNNLDIASRMGLLKRVLNVRKDSTTANSVVAELRKNKIKYLYSPEQFPEILTSQVHQVFEKGTISIYAIE